MVEQLDLRKKNVKEEILRILHSLSYIIKRGILTNLCEMTIFGLTEGSSSLAFLLSLFAENFFLPGCNLPRYLTSSNGTCARALDRISLATPN